MAMYSKFLTSWAAILFPKERVLRVVSLSLSLSLTHTHTHIYTYIYIYICIFFYPKRITTLTLYFHIPEIPPLFRAQIHIWNTKICSQKELSYYSCTYQFSCLAIATVKGLNTILILARKLSREVFLIILFFIIIIITMSYHVSW